MTQPFPGYNPPAAGFDQPVEMLASCHDRLVDRCSTLTRLVDHVLTHGADEQTRSAAQSVLRYFDGPAMYHHADEEQDLFPALLECVAGSDAVCLRNLFDRLAGDHRRLENHWQRLRPLLMQLADGVKVELPRHEIQAFVDEYAEHLQCEEEELLPLARRMLDETALEKMGRAMNHRRNPA